MFFFRANFDADRSRERRNCQNPIDTKGLQLLARRSEESCSAHFKVQSTNVHQEGQFPTNLQSLHGTPFLTSKVAALVLLSKKKDNNTWSNFFPLLAHFTSPCPFISNVGSGLLVKCT